MTFVVSEACIRCNYTDCEAVCPGDACREGGTFLGIAPADCIDCAVCVPECPVQAIYAEEDLPRDQQVFTAFNAQQSKTLPMISRVKPALPDAQTWAEVRPKRSEVGL